MLAKTFASIQSARTLEIVKRKFIKIFHPLSAKLVALILADRWLAWATRRQLLIPGFNLKASNADLA